MSKQPGKPQQPVQQGVSPISGTAPPAEHRFKPGQSGNPRGRPAAGASLREFFDVLQDKSEAEVRRVARDRSVPVNKRAAAERWLRAIEAGDLADMEPLLDGVVGLAELRRRGVNTEVIRKVKVRRKTLYAGGGAVGEEVEREVELHDRAGEDFDRICDRTEGKPKQSVTHGGDVGLRTQADGVAEAEAILAELRSMLGPPDVDDQALTDQQENVQ